jgi:P4 family phage/plasmid primase-like protien
VARALMPSRITRLTNKGLEIDCPNHASESKTSLHVDRAKQLWTCFGCGVGGDVIQLVEFVESGVVTRGARGQMPVTHRRARDWMAARAGFPPLEAWGLSEDEAKAVESRREMEDRVFGLLTFATTYYQEQLLESPEILAWAEKQWGFDPETVQRFALGYAENAPRTSTGLRERALAAGWTDEDLITTGLRNKKGGEFFRHRLMFPFWSRGKVTFLIGRQTPWTEETEFERAKYRKLRVHNPDDERGKFIAPCITNEFLWGADSLLSRPAQVVITEGVADAVALAVRGVPVVSPVTVKFRKGDLENLGGQLAAAEVSRVVVCMDNEVSRIGIRSALEIGRELRKKVRRVGVLALPIGPRQTAARATLLEDFAFRSTAGDHEFKRLLETLTPERQAEARALQLAAKIDVAEWFREGGTVERFLDLARLAPTPLEQAVRDIPGDLPAGEELDDVLDPILEEVSALKVAAQDRMLKLIREAIPNGPSLSVLRRQMCEANKSRKAHRAGDLVAFPGNSSAPTLGPDGPRRLTDTGNAERLYDRHGNDLHFCHAWQKWLIWDGNRYKIDDMGEIARRAVDTVRAIYGEAERVIDKEERAETVRWAKSSESKTRIDAMIGLGKSQEGIPKTPEDFDRDIWALNVLNGTINLKTGVLASHDQRSLHTKMTPVAFDPSARCPTWIAFLDRIMAGNAGLIRFIQRAIGYSLTGDTGERLMFILWGSGANGKSTLLETVSGLTGDYGTVTGAETLMAKRENGIANDLAALKGVRFVSASETEEQNRLAETKIKRMTGGDTITARFLYAENFSFRPEFKIWLATNHKPVIRGTDEGIWDRIRLIPFQVRIPPEERDVNLRKKLECELPGILSWAVKGCLEWQKHGLAAPEEVRAAGAEYREEMDVMGAFIDQCCESHVNAMSSASSLYEAYTNWASKNGEYAITQRAFGLRLSERGFQRHRSSGGRHMWTGIQLVEGRSE